MWHQNFPNGQLWGNYIDDYEFIWSWPDHFLGGIILYGMGTLFSFITLPVEYDASKRALVWLETGNMLSREEHNAAEDSLKWAARTYVVAAVGSLATLLYFISIYLGRD